MGKIEICASKNFPERTYPCNVILVYCGVISIPWSSQGQSHSYNQKPTPGRGAGDNSLQETLPTGSGGSRWNQCSGWTGYAGRHRWQGFGWLNREAGMLQANIRMESIARK